MKDCGCGGGKNNCITKKMVKKFEKKYPNAMKGIKLYNFVKSELNKLDCGCGCKGEKKFCDKYELKGGKLADCPPGWSQDPLTCVKNCPEGWKQDPLTCVKPCDEGQITDPLTCRNRIQSSMNDCPEGSRDIWGTCWGPKQYCIDDCFKHPAPGCRTWQCGRLKGAFGEDWGPKWCTDCNLRCGQTCWTATGITKQLHERQLRIWGGEINGRQIIGREIRGRVDIGATFKEMENLAGDIFNKADTFSKQQFGISLDPEKNGVAAAFRKFGVMTLKAFEEIGRGIEEGFKRFAAILKKGAEDLWDGIKGLYNNVVPDWLKDRFADPYFWVDFAIVVTQVAATVGGIVVTAGTFGTAGPAVAAGLMALNAAGPAIKMAADASRGEPINGLDIASIIFALVPGVGPGASAASQGITTALNLGMTSMKVLSHVNKLIFLGKLIIAGIKIAQAFGLVPSTYIANAPPPYRPDIPVPPDAREDEIEEYAKKNVPCWPGHKGTEHLWKPIDNPARCDGPPAGHWVQNQLALPPAQRQDLTKPYNSSITPPVAPTPPIPPTPPSGDDDYGPPPDDDGGDDDYGSPPDDEVNVETETVTPSVPSKTGPELLQDKFLEELRKQNELSGGAKSFEQMMAEHTASGSTDDPLLNDQQAQNQFNNQSSISAQPIPGQPGQFQVPFETKRIIYENDIPLTYTGKKFDVECFKRKNPELVQAMKDHGIEGDTNINNALISYWMERGPGNEKIDEDNNLITLDADCDGPILTPEQRMESYIRLSRDSFRLDAQKAACKAADKYWVVAENKCDGHYLSNGKKNTEVSECLKNNGFWDHEGNKTFCNYTRNPDGTYKAKKEICNTYNNYWDESKQLCEYLQNVDGSLKNEADVCTGLNAYWDDKDKKCINNKDRYGKEQTDELLWRQAGHILAKDWYNLIDSILKGNKIAVENYDKKFLQVNLADDYSGSIITKYNAIPKVLYLSSHNIKESEWKYVNTWVLQDSNGNPLNSPEVNPVDKNYVAPNYAYKYLEEIVNKNPTKLKGFKIIERNVALFDGAAGNHKLRAPYEVTGILWDGKIPAGNLMIEGLEPIYKTAEEEQRDSYFIKSLNEKSSTINDLIYSQELRFNEELLREYPELSNNIEAPRSDYKGGVGPTPEQNQAIINLENYFKPKPLTPAEKIAIARQKLEERMKDVRIQREKEYNEKLNTYMIEKIKQFEYDPTEQYDDMDIVTFPNSTNWKDSLVYINNPNFDGYSFDGKTTLIKYNRNPINNNPLPDWYLLDTSFPGFWVNFLYDSKYNPRTQLFLNKYVQNPIRQYLEPLPSRNEELAIKRKMDLFKYDPNKNYPKVAGYFVTVEDPDDPNNIYKTKIYESQYTDKHKDKGSFMDINDFSSGMGWWANWGDSPEVGPEKMGGPLPLFPVGEKWKTFLSPSVTNPFVESGITDVLARSIGSGKNNLSFTLYYSDQCGHCHDMMPEWDKLKKKYKDIQIRKLEANDNTELEVRAFPTMIYRNGTNMETYEGDRTFEAFKQFLDSKLSGGKKIRKLKSC